MQVQTVSLIAAFAAKIVVKLLAMTEGSTWGA
jgi:hypothetical protein